VNRRWPEEAACADLDPDRWFPAPHTPRREVAAVVAVCARCLVRDECLRMALDNDERYGIWGGVTADARRYFIHRPGRPDRLRREGAA
jgi:WhiB family redox-sensing transcriptional regulator